VASGSGWLRELSPFYHPRRFSTAPGPAGVTGHPFWLSRLTIAPNTRLQSSATYPSTACRDQTLHLPVLYAHWVNIVLGLSLPLKSVTHIDPIFYAKTYEKTPQWATSI
jgi:hypothetical protein